MVQVFRNFNLLNKTFQMKEEKTLLMFQLLTNIINTVYLLNIMDLKLSKINLNSTEMSFDLKIC